MRTSLWVVLAVCLMLGSPSLAGKGGKPAPPAPPPDPAIAYIRTGSGKGSGDLMVANDDGSNQTVVLAAGRGISHSRPCWSPDGTMLAFASNIEGPGVYTIGIDGTGLTKLAPVNWSPASIAPDWSPAPAADGEYKIAFTDLPRNEDGTLGPNEDLFVVNPDGSGLQNLTNTPDVYEASPAWATSATRLALWDIGDENILHDDILVLDIGLGSEGLEVTAELNLTSEADVPGGLLNDAGVRNPSWARGQDRIIANVRSSDPDVGGDLWIIDLADPANPTNLTETPELAESHPCWSPDDTRVVCHVIGSGLHVLPADGTGSPARIVTNGTHASWRR